MSVNFRLRIGPQAWSNHNQLLLRAEALAVLLDEVGEQLNQMRALVRKSIDMQQEG